MATRIIGERYRVISPLGEGGMGQVLRVEDQHTRRPLALKMLHADVAADPVQRERFKREFAVLRGLDHPTLVRLLDGDFESATPYLVFELVEGVGLDRLLADGPLPLKRALHLATQIAEALAVLHDHKIVHRDLKPSNVMVRPGDQVCLLDFGIAKHFGDAQRTIDRLTRTGYIVGTPQYMPPEGLDASHPITPAYDIWSVGVILYELVSGCHPFATAEQSVAELIDAVTRAEVFPLLQVRPDVPRGVVSVVSHCLALDPADRPADGREAAEMLSAVSTEAPGRSGPTEPVEAPGRSGVPYGERFEVMRELGKGGMGVVYLARQKSLDRLVALKVLDPRHSASASLAIRFRREAAAMVGLKHPNLIHLYDYDLAAAEPYLVIELVEGDTTLVELIEAADSTFSRSMGVCLELASAVAYLHDNNIVHRDLKPGNVLIDPRGHPRLTDFGLSRVMDPDSTQVTLDGQVLGTLNYMAPEQAHGDAATPRTDVYALGLVMFEVLARRRVFGGDGTQRCKPTVRFNKGVPDLGEHCKEAPEPVRRLIARCVALKPEDRPADARVVLAELDGLAGAEKDAGNVIRLQVEKYSGKHTVVKQSQPTRVASGRTSQPAVASKPAPPTVAPRMALVAVGLVSALAILGSLMFRTAVPGPAPTPTATASAVPSIDCRGTWTAVRAAVAEIVGPDGSRLEPLLNEMRGPLRSAGPAAAASAIQAAIGEQRLEAVRTSLRTACGMVDAERTGVAMDRQLLSLLGALEVLDELAESMGERPVFGGALMSVMGPYAGVREMAPQQGDPVYGVFAKPTYHVLSRDVEWDAVLTSAPPADVDITLVANDLDPKAIVQVTLNRNYRLHFRNRTGIAGSHTYSIPRYVLPPRTVPLDITYFPDRPFPRFTVLTRRVPRGVLRRGSNRFQVSAFALPGPLRLAGGRTWKSSGLDQGTVWHAYAAFRPQEIQR